MERYNAVVKDIQSCYERGQPVLVGTTSIENSELISDLLNKANLPHQVLNAKQHAREAEIVAQAGRPKMITIATNMAGRGTDIVLGGNVEKQAAIIEADSSIPAEEKKVRIQKLHDEWEDLHSHVVREGGLHIIGTERHESRRVDNQLRGRSGRQGDPGSSRFFLSLDDALLRIFAGDRLKAIMDRLRMPEGEPIEAGMVTRSIESAQRKVEARNFDIRKQLLQYDDVANDQRKEVYRLRNEVLETKDIGDLISNLRDSFFTDLFAEYVPPDSVVEQWDIQGLQQILSGEWALDIQLQSLIDASESIEPEDILEKVLEAVRDNYQFKVDMVGRESFANFERSVTLYSLDTHWREHLAALDHLRQGIHLRGYAQKDPKQEYRREAFELFARLLDAVKLDVTRTIMTVKIETAQELEEASEAIQEDLADLKDVQYQHQGAESSEENQSSQASAVPKVGRNDPCPCGSGKKYKQCHGQLG
jgi:preprotein translocase subunit SecA